jgi:rhodanese-related sulfurtransferase
MVPMLAKTATHLISEARAQIENLSPEEAAREIRRGHPLLVDLRETEECLAHGSIPGSTHAPRGMLEFYADPTSAYYRAEFDPQRRTILYCASGGRSALAAAALQTLGYARVAHLDGGLAAWREAGMAINKEKP